MSDVKVDIMNARVTVKNVPLHTLAKFTFKDVAAACNKFKDIPSVEECVVVQTSSRVEIFMISNVEEADTPDARRAEGKSLVLNQIKDMWISLSSLEQVDIDHFDQTIEVYKGDDTYRHLLRVATGLDSVVVGKQEIHDEIAKSIGIAREAGSSGRIFDRIFDNVLRMSARIRATTGISSNVVSLGDVAIKLVDEKAGLDAKKKVLLIGTGEPAAMVAKTLNQKGIPFDVTSRTVERAAGFSSLLGGTPVDFAEVLTGFDKYDIVLVVTTSDYFLVTFDSIHLVMEEKKKGTLILDLSDPRAVDEGITALPSIKLLFRDQVYEMYEENVKVRKGIVPAVEAIIEKDLPVLSALINKLDA